MAPARGGGKITAISGTAITVQTRDGSAKIATTATTTFQLDGKPARLSDIKVGMFAHAEGSKGVDGTFTATRVHAGTKPPAGPPQGGPGQGVGGKITAISGTTITVQTRDGSAKIATTATTTFQLDGKPARLSDIKVGMFAHAEGSRAADGTFTARCLLASTKAPDGPPPHR